MISNGCSKITPISETDQRLEAACRWIISIEDGLSPNQRTSLEKWLAEDHRNIEVLLEVATAWDKLDSLSRLAEIIPLEFKSAIPARSSPFLRAQVWATAASALLVVSVALWMVVLFDSGPNTDEVLQVTADYRTAIGEQKTLLLADGSEVVLNTHSVLRVVYTNTARVLHLERGELHIDVASDTKRPLSVIAGNQVVQALGTVFGVEITQENLVEVLVTEGKVLVGARQRPSSYGESQSTDADVPMPLRLSPTESNTIGAGETTVLGGTDHPISAVSEEEIEELLSWRDGRLIFSGEPLEQALAEVQRYTTVEFVLLDDDLRSQTLSGRFRAGDVEALLVSLQLNFKIAYEYDEDGRVLLTLKGS